MRAALVGAATAVPGLYPLLRRRATGGTHAAAYCYGVWLKHLSIASHHGFVSVPESVAELGPGNSLGTGIAALLSGANRYVALDVIRYVNDDRNLSLVDELVDMFQRRAAPANRMGWPPLDPYLDARGFPSALLTDDQLSHALRPARIDAIREAVASYGRSGDITVDYKVPWNDPAVVDAGSVDMVFSHTVVEYLEDLRGSYGAMYRWLRPGGLMSHQIDFSSLGTASTWNGHWGYSDRMWHIIRGRRTWFINREPHSHHLVAMQEAGFEVVCDLVNERPDGLDPSRLAPEWRSMSIADASTKNAFIQARRPDGRQLSTPAQD